jgi:hypothetical protein
MSSSDPGCVSCGAEVRLLRIRDAPMRIRGAPRADPRCSQTDPRCPQADARCVSCGSEVLPGGSEVRLVRIQGAPRRIQGAPRSGSAVLPGADPWCSQRRIHGAPRTDPRMLPEADPWCSHKRSQRCVSCGSQVLPQMLPEMRLLRIQSAPTAFIKRIQRCASSDPRCSHERIRTFPGGSEVDPRPPLQMLPQVLPEVLPETPFHGSGGASPADPRCS